LTQSDLNVGKGIDHRIPKEGKPGGYRPSHPEGRQAWRLEAGLPVRAMENRKSLYVEIDH